jgi:hypothetical protein
LTNARHPEKLAPKAQRSRRLPVLPSKPGIEQLEPQHDRGDVTDDHCRGRLSAAARALLTAGAIAGTSMLIACGGDTTPGPEDEAPAADVAAEEVRQDPTPTPTPDNQVVSTKGADGKSYSCPLTAMASINSARDQVTRREKVLKARKAAVRKIEKKYPGGTAPAAVVDRYNRLFARANAQVKHTNRAIRQYNSLLRSECNPS